MKQANILRNAAKTAALLAVLTFAACGGKGGNAGSTEQTTDTTVVAAAPLKADILMTYFCVSNLPDSLTVSGGTPFDDELAPYKITVKENNFEGVAKVLSVEKRDGAAVFAVSSNVANDNIEEGHTLVLIVTDAAGATVEVERFIEYCP